MGEVVNVLVAVAVIVFIVRWATSGKDSAAATQSPSSVLGFRPKNVTPEMVEAVHNMFPDIPSDNIRYDLLRTGDVQQTSNRILERGFLPPPPNSYYTIYPRALDPVPSQTSNAATTNTNASSSAKGKSRASDNLITRYGLQDRVGFSSSGSGSVSAAVASGASVGSLAPEMAGGKAKWEESAEKREASLRERKAQMILAARERLLAQQRAEAQASSSA